MIISMLMCPHCHNSTSIEGEPKEAVLYPCNHCETSFKVIMVKGQLMTANAGDNDDAIKAEFDSIPNATLEEAIAKLGIGMRSFSTPGGRPGSNWVKEALLRGALQALEPREDRVPIDLFSMLLGRNKGEPVTDDNWRNNLPDAVLVKCQCRGCREEMRKRAEGAEGPGEEDGPWAEGWEQRAGQPSEGTLITEELPANAGMPIFGLANAAAMPNVPDLMMKAAETFRTRNTLYGNSYHHFHSTMRALFPEGLTLNTPDEWNRAGILFFMVSKLVRYANNWKDGGHIDSAHDLGVYSFMLEELSRLHKGEF